MSHWDKKPSLPFDKSIDIYSVQKTLKYGLIQIFIIELEVLLNMMPNGAIIDGINSHKNNLTNQDVLDFFEGLSLVLLWASS
jgi:hypothetical protein